MLCRAVSLLRELKALLASINKINGFPQYAEGINARMARPQGGSGDIFGFQASLC